MSNIFSFWHLRFNDLMLFLVTNDIKLNIPINTRHLSAVSVGNGHLFFS